jgi:hypothetical protein
MGGGDGERAEDRDPGGVVGEEPVRRLAGRVDRRRRFHGDQAARFRGTGVSGQARREATAQPSAQRARIRPVGGLPKPQQIGGQPGVVRGRVTQDDATHDALPCVVEHVPRQAVRQRIEFLGDQLSEPLGVMVVRRSRAQGALVVGTPYGPLRAGRDQDGVGLELIECGPFLSAGRGERDGGCLQNLAGGVPVHRYQQGPVTGREQQRMTVVATAHVLQDGGRATVGVQPFGNRRETAPSGDQALGDHRREHSRHDRRGIGSHDQNGRSPA